MPVCVFFEPRDPCFAKGNQQESRNPWGPLLKDRPRLSAMYLQSLKGIQVSLGPESASRNSTEPPAPMGVSSFRLLWAFLYKIGPQNTSWTHPRDLRLSFPGSSTRPGLPAAPSPGPPRDLIHLGNPSEMSRLSAANTNKRHGPTTRKKPFGDRFISALRTDFARICKLQATEHRPFRSSSLAASCSSLQGPNRGVPGLHFGSHASQLPSKRLVWSRIGGLVAKEGSH